MDLRKAIEKLNTIDAKDFKKIDLSKLKDYNFDKFKDDLSTKPNLLIKFILVIVAFVSILFGITQYKAVASSVRTKAEEIKQRLDMVAQKELAEGTYKKFVAEYPKIIPTNQLIGKISNFAEDSHINIVSFSPVKSSESTYVTQYVVNLVIQAKTYQDIVDFLYNVENSEYTLRINRWNAKAQGSVYGDYKGEKDVPLEAYMEIGSVQLNDI